MQRTFIGLHVPKCAGTSLIEMALSALPRERIHLTEPLKNWLENQSSFLDLRNYEQVRLVWGHTVQEEMIKYFDDPVVFAGLREPVDRLHSEVAYQQRLRNMQGATPLDINEFLKTVDNPACRFLLQRFPQLSGDKSLTLFERASTVLDSFHYIYFTDGFDSFSAKLLSLLGADSVVPEYRNTAPEKYNKFNFNLTILDHDRRLYEWAHKRFAGLSFEQMIDTPNSRLEAFRSQPKNAAALKQWLFGRSFAEFQSWNRLEELIAVRTRELENLKEEIAYYTSRVS